MNSVRKYIQRGLSQARKLVLPGNEPSIFILGGQKCGTSSLHFYLEQHPEICGGTSKEVGYFHRDIYFGRSYSDYQKEFLGSKQHLYVDSTPEYLYHPDTSKQIFEVQPSAKMIVLIRDPVKRAYSAWNHYRQLFENDLYIETIKNYPRREGNLLYEKFFHERSSFPTFRECIDIELDLIDRNIGFEPALLRRGLYLAQLQNYWEYFDKSQIMIIGFQDFVKDTIGTLSKVTTFLGAKDISWNNITFEAKNVREYTEQMSDKDRVVCECFFKEPNQKLFEIIDRVNW